MADVLPAFIRLARDLLIGLMIAAGFGVVLVVRLVTVTIAHPLVAVLIMLAIIRCRQSTVMKDAPAEVVAKIDQQRTDLISVLLKPT
jgi:hypothetical protein